MHSNDHHSSGNVDLFNLFLSLNMNFAPTWESLDLASNFHVTIISVQFDLQLIQNLITLSWGYLVSGRFDLTPSQMTGPKIGGGGGQKHTASWVWPPSKFPVKELLGKKTWAISMNVPILICQDCIILNYYFAS